MDPADGLFSHSQHQENSGKQEYAQRDEKQAEPQPLGKGDDLCQVPGTGAQDLRSSQQPVPQGCHTARPDRRRPACSPGMGSCLLSPQGKKDLRMYGAVVPVVG